LFSLFSSDLNLFSVAAELQNKLQELERHLSELNDRRMMLEVELSIIDTSDRKVVGHHYACICVIFYIVLDFLHHTKI